jgi:LysM repeat protein
MESTHIEEHASSFLVSSFIPVAISLIGVVIGATALYFSILKSGSVSEPEIKGVRKELEVLNKRLSEFEMITEQLADNNVKLASQIKTLTNQAQQQSREIEQSALSKRTATQAQISTEIPHRVNNTQNNSATTNNFPSSKVIEHAIGSGDTLAKLSQQYNVPLNVLISANPGIDPKKLKIGQVIVIPIGR